MKILRIVLAMFAFAAMTWTADAQTSALSGKDFKIILKEESGMGPEIQDRLIFNNGMVVADGVKKLFPETSVTENNNGGNIEFQFTLTSSSQGTRVFTGVVQNDAWISGTMVHTDASGVQTNYFFRGTTQRNWDEMTQSPSVGE